MADSWIPSARQAADGLDQEHATRNSFRRYAQRLQHTLSPWSSLFVSVTAYVRGKALVSRTHCCAVNQHYEALALTRTACCAARPRSTGAAGSQWRRVWSAVQGARGRLQLAHLSPWKCSPSPHSYGLCALRFMHPAVVCAAAWHLHDGCKCRPSHPLAYLSWHARCDGRGASTSSFGSLLNLVIF